MKENGPDRRTKNNDRETASSPLRSVTTEKRGEAGCKRLRQERSETARGGSAPGGRFAQSNGLGLLRPARFAA